MALDPIEVRNFQNLIYDLKDIFTDREFLYKLETVAQVIPGKYKNPARELRKKCTYIERLLKEYRKQSLAIDKAMPKLSNHFHGDNHQMPWKNKAE